MTETLIVFLIVLIGIGIVYLLYRAVKSDKRDPDTSARYRSGYSGDSSSYGSGYWLGGDYTSSSSDSYSSSSGSWDSGSDCGSDSGGDCGGGCD